MEEPNKIGEVIEASTTDLVAQCYKLYRLPPLGSLVKTGVLDMELCGIVCGAGTRSFDESRRPIARGKDEKSVDDIYNSSPQLTKLLRSEFSILVVGHRQGDRVYQYLPPQPAKIHDFIYECTPDEVKQFSRSFNFLSILVNAPLTVPFEELIAASLRHMSDVYGEERHAFMVAAGKELATLLSGDFNRLKAILERMRV